MKLRICVCVSELCSPDNYVYSKLCQNYVYSITHLTKKLSTDARTSVKSYNYVYLDEVEKILRVPLLSTIVYDSIKHDL